MIREGWEKAADVVKYFRHTESRLVVYMVRDKWLAKTCLWAEGEAREFDTQEEAMIFVEGFVEAIRVFRLRNAKTLQQ